MIESNALSGIIEGVIEDVSRRTVPISQLKEELTNAPVLRDAYAALSKKDMSLIAEIKRSSPSKGDLAAISGVREGAPMMTPRLDEAKKILNAIQRSK